MRSYDTKIMSPPIPDRLFTANDEASIKRLRELVTLIGNDGHSIWASSILDGFSPGIRSRFVTTHLSSADNLKEMIANRRGVVVDQMNGISGLKLLTAIAGDLGLSCDFAVGRGTKAGHATAAILAHLDSFS